MTTTQCGICGRLSSVCILECYQQGPAACWAFRVAWLTERVVELEAQVETVAYYKARLEDEVRGPSGYLADMARQAARIKELEAWMEEDAKRAQMGLDILATAKDYSAEEYQNDLTIALARIKELEAENREALEEIAGHDREAVRVERWYSAWSRRWKAAAKDFRERLGEARVAHYTAHHQQVENMAARITALDAELDHLRAALRSQVTALEAERDAWITDCRKAELEAKALRAERDRLREAGEKLLGMHPIRNDFDVVVGYPDTNPDDLISDEFDAAVLALRSALRGDMP